jgi:sulfur-oxidizing protein SoxZ
VKNVTVTVNGKTVLDGQWGGGISKDPYLGFKVKGLKAGDKVTVTAEDNKGDKGGGEATVS